MLRLIGTDSARYYSWELTPGQHMIGRKSDCDLPVINNTVSRKHARLEVPDTGDECTLTDLDSHNGTFINGQVLKGSSTVKAGDHIRFGQTEFKLSGGTEEQDSTMGGGRAAIVDASPMEHSVMLSMDEALKPLPSKITDLPQLVPTLFNMAKMLVLPEPREVVLERSLDMVSKLIPHDRLAVLFIIEGSDELQTAASIQPPGKSESDFRLSQTIVNEILKNRNAILIADAAEDSRFAEQQSIIMSEMKSAMAVPLLDEGKVLGILYAETLNPLHHYNDSYLRLFATVGNIIASRLLNYALLTERQEKQIYESELHRASQIQESLTPTNIPDLPGYSIETFQEQCRAVGGDLYELTLMPDGSLIFMVADVSGKGMGAALLMSNILASFRILFEDNSFDLEKAVTSVSLQLYKYSPSESFATLFIGIIKDNKLSYVNAGHNPPLLLRQDGSLEYIEASGTMIGAFDFSSWSEESTIMNQGDCFVVFTDGIPEATLGGDEDFSDERLEQLIQSHVGCSPEELTTHIMDDVNNYLGESPRTDDITMVIIKRND